MTDSAVKKAVSKAHNLDEASQTLRASAKKKWNRAIVLGFAAFLILLAATGIGIWATYNQGVQSRQHIDCIIKDLSTPLPPGAKTKYIDYKTRLSSDCKIKFN